MALENIVYDIFTSYSEIEIESSPEVTNTVVFRLGERRFAYLCPHIDNITSSGLMFALDDISFDHPHIMLGEIDYQGDSVLPKGKYRSICLHESGSVIYSLMSYEEKIADSIERLITLMTLSPIQKEREFQKEFLVYWNNVAQAGKREVYLDNDNLFSILTVYQNSEGIRYVAPQIRLNDLHHCHNEKDTWRQRLDTAAVFVPIINNRGVLPPTKDHLWNEKQIIEIICSDITNHISENTFQQLATLQIIYNTLDIVFGIQTTQIPYFFLVRVHFRGNNKLSVLERIRNYIDSVEMLRCKRKDFAHLNSVIGNGIEKINKNVLLVGAGSLGSYVACELAKNGFRKITIYDGDDLDSENFMRWYYSGILGGGNKATLIKFYLEKMHSEICIDAHNKNIDSIELTEKMSLADYIIFTVGSSDTQLRFNRILRENNCAAKVFFVWLEAGGEYSHVLRVDYSVSGCYECLFTNDRGDMVNNQANIADDDIVDLNTIHNGCGATRTAYGTSVLLRTTSVLLDILNKEEHEKIVNNYVVHIRPDVVKHDNVSFIKEVCRCCGN